MSVRFWHLLSLAGVLAIVAGCGLHRYDYYVHTWEVEHAKSRQTNAMTNKAVEEGASLLDDQISVGMQWDEVSAICGHLTDRPNGSSFAQPLREQRRVDSVSLYWFENRLQAIIVRGWSIEPW